MKRRPRVFVAIALSITLPYFAQGSSVRPDELAAARQWAMARFEGGLDGKHAEPFFSFSYGGEPMSELLGAWKHTRSVRQLDPQREEFTLTYAEPQTGVTVRCVGVVYADFPVVEWTVYFRNEGTRDTRLLEKIRAIDVRVERPAEGEFVLHYCKGDIPAPSLYQPMEQRLAPRSSYRFAPTGGRPSNGAFPYYNLQMPGGGLMIAIGWPGQWMASFARDQGRGLQIAAGQETTRLVLHPGERIRTPLMALLFWQGDDLQRAQNLWRRWMIAHNLPRTSDGKVPPPLLFGNTSCEFDEMQKASEENQKQFIDRYREERIGIDAWWMDAGWYVYHGGWWDTGTWEVDRTRFPHGLRAIADHAHANSTKTLVWFEPERVKAHTWLWDERPQWLLGQGQDRLLNLGDPDAWRWVVNHVDRLIVSQGIDFYRQDFNIDPLNCWRGADRPDRQGITENKYVQGYLAYWDELRRRHPNLIIDSCASGGRRNDLETLRRAIALHPSDFDYTNLTVKQSFHQSLFQWIPYFGSNTLPIDTVDSYAFRSGHAMGVVLGYDLRRTDLDYDRLRKLTAEWRLVSPCYYGDYYPLIPYSLDNAAWIAWQFDCPESAQGWSKLSAATRAPSNRSGACSGGWSQPLSTRSPISMPAARRTQPAVSSSKPGSLSQSRTDRAPQSLPTKKSGEAATSTSTAPSCRLPAVLDGKSRHIMCGRLRRSTTEEDDRTVPRRGQAFPPGNETGSNFGASAWLTANATK